MEAQSVALRGYIHGALSSLQSRKTDAPTKFPKPFTSEIRCSFQSISSTTKRNLRCRSSVEKVEYNGVFDAEKDSPKSRVSLKKLAVFVSGGGSNFRSIYEATLNGSVHGDIVALVTNKHGIVFFCILKLGQKKKMHFHVV